ncbi:MAG: DUF4136 domain-containing protein [Gemmatimonadales bacterium]
MRRLLTAAALAGVVLAAGSCYPGRVTDDTRYDTVSTLFEQGADFGGIRTYSLPDSVIHLVPPGEIDDVPRTYDALILAEVRASLNARGYTDVGDTDTSDAVVLVGAASSDWIVYGGWWNYWCWWDPFYCSGGYYPPYWGAYTFTTGSIMILMTDRRTPGPGAEPSRAIWLAAINGLLGGGSTAALISANIDQAFAQSPYVAAQP